MNGELMSTVIAIDDDEKWNHQKQMGIVVVHEINTSI